MLQQVLINNMNNDITVEEIKKAVEIVRNKVEELTIENARYEVFINSLLNPEEYGYAVSNEVRDAARIALRMEPVESCLAKKIKLQYHNTYLDGGTEVYSGSDHKIYYVDYRLGTTTHGEIFDRYPDNEGAKMLNKNCFEFIS